VRAARLSKIKGSGEPQTPPPTLTLRVTPITSRLKKPLVSLLRLFIKKRKIYGSDYADEKNESNGGYCTHDAKSHSNIIKSFVAFLQTKISV